MSSERRVPEERNRSCQRANSHAAPEHEPDLHDLDGLGSFGIGHDERDIIEETLPYIDRKILHERETEPRQIGARLGQRKRLNHFRNPSRPVFGTPAVNLGVRKFQQRIEDNGRPDRNLLSGNFDLEKDDRRKAMAPRPASRTCEIGFVTASGASCSKR